MNCKPLQPDQPSGAAFDWAAVVDGIRFSPDGLPLLSDSIIPPGDPDVENQISAPESPWAVTFFKQFHLPMIRSARVDPAGCRILEIGSGFGRLGIWDVPVHPARAVYRDRRLSPTPVWHWLTIYPDGQPAARRPRSSTRRIRCFLSRGSSTSCNRIPSFITFWTIGPRCAPYMTASPRPAS